MDAAIGDDHPLRNSSQAKLVDIGGDLDTLHFPMCHEEYNPSTKGLRFQYLMRGSCWLKISLCIKSVAPRSDIQFTLEAGGVHHPACRCT